MGNCTLHIAIGIQRSDSFIHVNLTRRQRHFKTDNSAQILHRK
jgi:hypothetical protein